MFKGKREENESAQRVRNTVRTVLEKEGTREWKTALHVAR